MSAPQTSAQWKVETAAGIPTAKKVIPVVEKPKPAPLTYEEEREMLNCSFHITGFHDPIFDIVMGAQGGSYRQIAHCCGTVDPTVKGYERSLREYGKIAKFIHNRTFLKGVEVPVSTRPNSIVIPDEGDSGLNVLIEWSDK